MQCHVENNIMDLTQNDVAELRQRAQLNAMRGKYVGLKPADLLRLLDVYEAADAAAEELGDTSPEDLDRSVRDALENMVSEDDANDLRDEKEEAEADAERWQNKAEEWEDRAKKAEKALERVKQAAAL
jgi:predicted ribosome quality control (RQC) complex YloA/Tae2 family protein